MVRIAQLCSAILLGSMAGGCGGRDKQVVSGVDAATGADGVAAIPDRSDPSTPESSTTVVDLGMSVTDLRGAEDLPTAGEGHAGLDEALDSVDAATFVPAETDARGEADGTGIEGGFAQDVASHDVAAAGPSDIVSTEGPAASSPFRVLIFSRTAGFRHASIPTAVAALMSLQAAGGYQAEATEDASVFTLANLMRFQVVVFALTSGDILDDAQQAAFESWVAAGGGTVGIHSASDTEYDWPFYGDLIGAYFKMHPEIQMATVRVEAPDHPIMVGVPTTWARRDEWYAFVTNPRPKVTVLATVDESTYSGGGMGPDHPIIWARTTAGGARSFYTALGHTPESYAEAPFRQHLVNGIRWAAGR